MATYRWTGVSASYSNRASWLPSGPPGFDDVVTIDVPGIVATVSGIPSFVVGNLGSGALSVANTAELLLQPGIQLFVGNRSGVSGTLALTSGASLVDQAGTGGDIIGFTLGATGTVSVDGAGTTWSTNGRIFVGLNGTGTLLVSNGGSVSATGLGSASTLSIYAGASAGSSGLIKVTDPGSALTTTGRIGIGSSGNGELDVLNGATVSTSFTPTQGRSSVFAGGDVGTNGKIVVSGTGSRIDAGGGQVSVAVPGSVAGPLATGTLVVSGGATLFGGSANPQIQAGLLVGDSQDVASVSSIVAAGFVTIDGAGSLVSILGNANFGRSGSAVLVMSNGGSASLGSIPGTVDGGINFATSFGSVAQATIDTGATLSSIGRILVGANGNADVIVRGGGLMSSTLSSFDMTALQTGVAVANTGGTSSLVVTGAGSALSSNGNFSIGRGGSGTFLLASGATATSSASLRLGGSQLDSGVVIAVGTGAATVDGAGSRLSAGNLYDGVDASGTLGIGVGALAVRHGGQVSFSGAAALGGSASLSVDSASGIEIGGTLGAPAGMVMIDAGGMLSGHGAVAGTVSLAGTIDAVGGLLRFANAVSGQGVMTIEASGTLELGAAAGNTANVAFNGAGTLRLDTPGSFSGILQALPNGATIDLVGDSGATATIVGTTLQIRWGGGAYDFALASNDAGLAVSTMADGAAGALAGTNVVIACFAAGTRIATPGGSRRVDDLRERDLVILARGGTAPIVWLGHRRVVARHHPQARDVGPVRVKAGAFGPGLPARDLCLSPDHAVFVEGVLIPVRSLTDGRWIVSEPFEAITYWHVELAVHDVLLAEGLPCESYLDTGNRSAFANTSPTQIHPAFDRDVLMSDMCARRVTCGPVIEKVKARLRRREAKPRKGVFGIRSA